MVQLSCVGLWHRPSEPSASVLQRLPIAGSSGQARGWASRNVEASGAAMGQSAMPLFSATGADANETDALPRVEVARQAGAAAVPADHGAARAQEDRRAGRHRRRPDPAGQHRPAARRARPTACGRASCPARRAPCCSSSTSSSSTSSTSTSGAVLEHGLRLRGEAAGDAEPAAQHLGRRQPQELHRPHRRVHAADHRPQRGVRLGGGQVRGRAVRRDLPAHVQHQGADRLQAQPAALPAPLGQPGPLLASRAQRRRPAQARQEDAAGRRHGRARRRSATGSTSASTSGATGSKGARSATARASSPTCSTSTSAATTSATSGSRSTPARTAG